MARVTVTGGTGVLGRALVPRLLADGHQVIVVTRQPAALVPGGARRMTGDLARRDGLAAAVHGAEVVVHLATQPFRPARWSRTAPAGWTSTPGLGRPSLMCAHAQGTGRMSRPQRPGERSRRWRG